MQCDKCGVWYQKELYEGHGCPKCYLEKLEKDVYRLTLDKPIEILRTQEDSGYFNQDIKKKLNELIVMINGRLM